MSRIGKKPIKIPIGVEVKIEGKKITVNGSKGELSLEIRPEVKVDIKEDKIIISPQKETKETMAFWGLTRALISNMVDGVTKEFEKKLEIQGIGFGAKVEGKEIVLSVGFSNPIRMNIPEGINISVEKNIITISGINKELVGQIAATIRKVKPPEPYKGKGIRYLGEVVKRKVGKKAITKAPTARTARLAK